MAPTRGGRRSLAGPGQRAKLLVVDDDRAVREVIHDVLEGPEIEVSLAHDGKQALAFMEWDLYNVVVVDLRLPDVDGLSLLQEIKQRTPDTEAVVLSATGDLAAAVEALRLGACDYVRKPLEDMGLLRKSVERALERQELVLANRYLMDELSRANRELQRQRRRELRRLEEVGLALAGALQRDDVLEVLQRAVSAALSCDVLALYLFSLELGGPSVRVHSRWPLPDNLLASLHQTAREASGLPDAVERAAGNVEVNVIPAQPELATGAMETVISSKLATRGVTLGLVTVAAERAEAFASEEVQLLRILCNQAAVALENARLFQQAQVLATRDGLTGLLNHRTFYQRLEEEIARAKRHNVPLTMVLIDTDCLKRMNDRYGHLSGDEMLRVFARLIVGGVRRGDVVARYGGDEFAILLPHTTPEAALALCERLRRRVEGYQFTVGDQVEQIGASFGVAGFDPLLDPDDGREVVRRTDEALYKAKMAGRNRIEVAERAGLQMNW